jgi:uncharacterized membrane protein
MPDKCLAKWYAQLQAKGRLVALRILLLGESWATLSIHTKGFSTYSAGSYDEGGTPLIQALESTGHVVEYIPNHLIPSRCPATKQELATYDVVMLSDVGSDTFLLHPDTLTRSVVRPNVLKEMAAYVSDGGGLLMIGGFMSFSGIGGAACYQNTALARVLPVKMLGFDDRVECPESIVPETIGEHAILAGILANWPPFLGYQRLIAKDDALTIMQADADPFLTVGSHGRGRTAAFASDCSPHWGTPSFVGWSHYAQFWSQLAEWLSGR